ncbi:MAG: ABC transporter ATP-binding protein, partial [Clostridia bacterium]|nr:ABC transporter ATP-binding protein [Clostridia bacterium]
MDKENIIEIKNLCKSFKDVKAVDDLSFCVKKGELFAFLGVNGAGKSTTISIICNRLKNDSGQVYINGKNADEGVMSVKRNLGVVFQNSALDSALTVKDNLKNRASLYGITGENFVKRLAELDTLLDVSSLLKRAVGKLSGGQRRRVDIARALLHRPE